MHSRGQQERSVGNRAEAADRWNDPLGSGRGTGRDERGPSTANGQVIRRALSLCSPRFAHTLASHMELIAISAAANVLAPAFCRAKAGAAGVAARRSILNQLPMDKPSLSAFGRTKAEKLGLWAADILLLLQSPSAFRERTRLPAQKVKVRVFPNVPIPAPAS